LKSCVITISEGEEKKLEFVRRKNHLSMCGEEVVLRDGLDAREKKRGKPTVLKRNRRLKRLAGRSRKRACRGNRARKTGQPQSRRRQALECPGVLPYVPAPRCGKGKGLVAAQRRCCTIFASPLPRGELLRRCVRKGR